MIDALGIVLLVALPAAVGGYLAAHRLTIKGGRVVKRRWFKTDVIAIADLAEIKFHYHAVVGFTCVWEFVSRSGKSLEHESMYISKRLLKSLERALPGFSRVEFHRQFQEGDVEDSLEIWRRSL